MKPEEKRQILKWIEKSMKKGHKPKKSEIREYCHKRGFSSPTKKFFNRVYFKYRSSAVRSTFRKPKIFAGSKPYFGICQIDLAMFKSELKSRNEGCIGFIIGVELLTTQIQVVPVKSKKQSEFERAINHFISFWDDSLHTIVSDEDSALSKTFQSRMEHETGIKFKQLRTGSKAATAEKYISFMKQRLSLSLDFKMEAYRKELQKTGKKSNPGEIFKLQNWISSVDDIVLRHNRKYIKNTNIVRGSINRDNYVEAIGQIYSSDVPYNILSEVSRDRYPKNFLDKLFTYKEKDLVLLNSTSYYKNKNIFEKKSLVGSFLPFPFEIHSRHLTLNKKLLLVPSYVLKDLKDNTILKGFFYSPNLRPALFLERKTSSGDSSYDINDKTEI